MAEEHEEITLEQVEELKAFLMGIPAEHLDLLIAKGSQPRLRPHAANTVIWYLQEILHVLPANYEVCQECGELYDEDTSGHLGPRGDGCYCDNCSGEEENENV